MYRATADCKAAPLVPNLSPKLPRMQGIHGSRSGRPSTDELRSDTPLDHYAQSQDRNHRIGRDAPVTYMRLIAGDTIDEAVVRVLERKSGLARALLGVGETATLVTDFTKDEMLDLIARNVLPDED